MRTPTRLVRSRAARVSLAAAGIAGLLIVPVVFASPVQAPERPQKDAAAERARLEGERADHMRRQERDMERLGDRMRRRGDEMERLGEELGRAATELAEASMCAHFDAFGGDHGHRHDAERARARVRELAGEMRDAARRARPSADEMRRIREEARSMAESVRPSHGDRQELRRAMREAMRDARREMERAREEIRRALREAYRAGVI